MRDLVVILYIIFVCIIAYGVVSRALVMSSDLRFNYFSIVSAVFYRPYWFLYSIVDDERNKLDGKIDFRLIAIFEIFVE